MNKKLGRKAAPGTLLDVVHRAGFTTADLAKYWGLSMAQIYRINGNPSRLHLDSVAAFIARESK